jgi:exodeoxyribonuclease VII small subunit
MADDPKTFDFTQSIQKLEEINAWFQNEDFNLDEGLHKLKAGKELIKMCRARLQEAENEFVKIKREFVEEVPQQEAEVADTVPNGNGPRRTSLADKEIDPNDVPF